MGRFRLVHSRSNISLTEVTDPDQIRDELLPEYCAADGITYDITSNSGVWYGRLTAVRYQWEVEATETEYILHQETRVSSKFVTLYLAQILSWAFVWAVLYYLQTVGRLSVDLFSLFELTIVMGGILLFGVYLLYQAFRSLELQRYPDPLIDLRDRGFRYSRYTSTKPLSILWYLNIPMIVLAGIADRPGLTLILGSDYVMAATLVLAGWYLDGGSVFLTLAERSRLSELSVSGLARRYISYGIQLSGLLVIVPALSVVFRIGIERFVVLDSGTGVDGLGTVTPISLPLFDELLALLVGLSALAALRSVGDEDKRIEYHEFQNRKGGHETSGRLVDMIAVLGSSVFVYVCLAKALELLFDLQIRQLPDSAISLPWTLSVAALLSLYFPAGIAYQHYQRSKRVDDILTNSVTKPLAVNGYEATVRVLDEETLYATSFSTRSGSHIVVSRGLVEALPKPALAAIAAHEEGHIQHGDTRLCNRIAIASTVLLVGQNVLYDLVNFYERERRADEYARESVGDEALGVALATLRNVDPDDSILESFGANFSPRVDSAADGVLAAPFELFFGGFALTDAHPSLDDRMQRLDIDPDTLSLTE